MKQTAIARARQELEVRRGQTSRAHGYRHEDWKWLRPSVAKTRITIPPRKRTSREKELREEGRKLRRQKKPKEAKKKFDRAKPDFPKKIENCPASLRPSDVRLDHSRESRPREHCMLPTTAAPIGRATLDEVLRSLEGLVADGMSRDAFPEDAQAQRGKEIGQSFLSRKSWPAFANSRRRLVSGRSNDAGKIFPWAP